MSISKPLEGKVAVVAGSTRGAGWGIACMLGEAGATLYCTGRSAQDNTVRMVEDHGGIAIGMQVDHTIPEQVQRLFARAAEEQGRLDILVNNVNGDDLYEWKPFWKLSLENGFRSLDRGINSHLITMYAALPLMLKRDGGLIVGITDQGGGTFFFGFVKQSVMRIVELLAPELTPHDITVVSLTPGYLRSEAVLQRLGVTETNWRDGVKRDPFFAGSETPFFVGRAVAALAADPRAILKTGTLLSSWELVEEYGFTDIDGVRPNVSRVFEPLLDERWEKLVRCVRLEFEKNGVKADEVLEPDRPKMTLRARLTDEPPRWLNEVVGPPGVVFGNLEKIASAFYQRFAKLR